MKHKVKVDCENCIFYEQKIKEKDQRIAELEKENKQLKSQQDENKKYIARLCEYIFDKVTVEDQPFCHKGSPTSQDGVGHIFMPFANCPQDCWECLEKYIKEDFEPFEKDYKKLEDEVEKYKKLLADKTQQFDSVRQRYHLLNRLQADYDKKDKLHLSEMQCLELVEQNEKLQEENAKVKQWLDNYGFKTLEEFDKYIEELCIDMKNHIRENAELSTENCNLKEQLKNTATSKFKTYQPVFCIYHYYTSTKGNGEYAIFSDYYYVAENENEIITGWNYKKDFNQRKYRYIRKDWVFATEAEAQKYLEQQNEIHSKC